MIQLRPCGRGAPDSSSTSERNSADAVCVNKRQAGLGQDTLVCRPFFQREAFTYPVFSPSLLNYELQEERHFFFSFTPGSSVLRSTIHFNICWMNECIHLCDTLFLPTLIYFLSPRQNILLLIHLSPPCCVPVFYSNSTLFPFMAEMSLFCSLVPSVHQNT